MAGTDNANTAQAPENRTYEAGQVTAALEKEKNAKEAQFELAYDLGHMSSNDFNKIYQQVQSNIKDWNKTHTGPDALTAMQLFDSKGNTVTDASKAVGIKFENSDTTQTRRGAPLQSSLNNLELSSTHQETKGDTTTTYDNDGNRLAIDQKNADGSSEHTEYDPITRHPVSYQKKDENGNVVEKKKFDPGTGEPIDPEEKDQSNRGGKTPQGAMGDLGGQTNQITPGTPSLTF